MANNTENKAPRGSTIIRRALKKALPHADFKVSRERGTARNWYDIRVTGMEDTLENRLTIKDVAVATGETRCYRIPKDDGVVAPSRVCLAIEFDRD